MIKIASSAARITHWLVVNQRKTKFKEEIILFCSSSAGHKDASAFMILLSFIFDVALLASYRIVSLPASSLTKSLFQRFRLNFIKKMFLHSRFMVSSFVQRKRICFFTYSLSNSTNFVLSSLSLKFFVLMHLCLCVRVCAVSRCCCFLAAHATKVAMTTAN